MICKHCDKVMKKTEPMKLCPIHYPAIACGVCLNYYNRMTADVPPEPGTEVPTQLREMRKT